MNEKQRETVEATQGSMTAQEPLDPYDMQTARIAEEQRERREIIGKLREGVGDERYTPVDGAYTEGLRERVRRAEAEATTRTRGRHD